VQPGPRISRPSCRSHSGRKERLRANPQTMDRQFEPTSPATDKPTAHPSTMKNVWRLGRWLCTPAPEIFRFGANPGETNRNGTLIGPSRLGSWRGARSRLRVALSPARSLTILSTINSWNQSPCAASPEKNHAQFTHRHLTQFLFQEVPPITMETRANAFFCNRVSGNAFRRTLTPASHRILGGTNGVARPRLAEIVIQ